MSGKVPTSNIPTPTPSMSHILSQICGAETNLSMAAIQLGGVSEKACDEMSQLNQKLQEATVTQLDSAIAISTATMVLGCVTAGVGLSGGLSKAMAPEGSAFASIGHEISECAEVGEHIVHASTKVLEGTGETMSGLREADIERVTAKNENMGTSNKATLEAFSEAFGAQSEMAKKAQELITSDRDSKTYRYNG